MQFSIPSRGLMGISNQILTLTEGEAILAHRFDTYAPHKGEIGNKRKGALISQETGTSIPFAIDKLQDRGIFLVPPGEPIYQGQVIGEHIRANDLVINICKTKKLTNMRASGSDDKQSIAPPKTLSLEQYMEYLKDDEYLEVTPKKLRVRKIDLFKKKY